MAQNANNLAYFFLPAGVVAVVVAAGVAGSAAAAAGLGAAAFFAFPIYNTLNIVWLI